MRAIDELIEGAEDPPHFERAAEQGRVLVSNDADQEEIAHQWYDRGRDFPGLIVWRHPQAIESLIPAEDGGFSLAQTA